MPSRLAPHSLSLTEIRSDAANRTLVVLTLFAVPALILSLSRVFVHGLHPQMFAHVGLFLALAAVTVRRRHLTLSVRAGFITMLLFAAGVVALMMYGVGSGAIMFFVSACIFAGCFFPVRVAVWSMVLACALILTIFTARLAGVIPEIISPLAYARDPLTWISACAALLFCCAGPIFALSAIAQGLEAERKRADDAAQARSQFLARMSHELRAPLTSVIGMTELLQGGSNLSPEQTTMTARILKAARHLLELLNDVLDFSKVEAGRIVLEYVPFRLADLVTETVELHAGAAAEKGIQLVTNTPHSYLDAVIGDRFRLGQVLSNLVSNAIKFTERGTVTIDVTQILRDDGLTFTTFSVSDTGIGISKEQLAKLFQPFVQADSSTSRKYGGSGLGLVISESLVNAMRGEISVASTVGKGSTFTFSVPLTPDAAIHVGAAAPAAAPTRKLGAPIINIARGLRILLADDDAMVHTLLKAVLEDADATVVSARNGQEAVEAAANATFDVILVDMHMPVMDGPEAIKAIRGSTGPSQNAPIIALTGDILTESKQAFIAAGANTVAAKPIVWPQLEAEINKLAVR
jgi:signal transduction histidine kinase/CheY-like chemotaxis protein